MVIGLRAVSPLQQSPSLKSKKIFNEKNIDISGPRGAPEVRRLHNGLRRKGGAACSLNAYVCSRQVCVFKNVFITKSKHF